MSQLRKNRARRIPRRLVASIGLLGVLVLATATLRAIRVQKDLDKRISSLKGELAKWDYYTKRSQELATKEDLLQARVGAQPITSADHDVEACLAAAAPIPPVPAELEWNPFAAPRAIREREEWCTSAHDVIASATACAASGALEETIGSIDRELAQIPKRVPR